MVTPYDGYVDVCERLAELTPGDHAKKSALFNSGAEAVENAVKIARASHRPGRRRRRRPRLPRPHQPHDGDDRQERCPTSTASVRSPARSTEHRCPTRSASARRSPARRPPTARSTCSRSRSGAANLACLVIEPILGEGGFVVPADGFLPRLREWTTTNGIVFVADEIQTGFCRTGDWFACDHEGVVPDLVTTAKGIAGGMPLAAVTGRAEIMDAVHVGGLGGTYGGNPVACAAALGAIETMRSRTSWGAPGRAGDLLEGPTARPRGAARCIGDVRGRGAMLAVEVVGPDGHTPEPGARRRRSPPTATPGRRHPHLRHLRQRAALPAAAGDPRGPARGGLRRGGGGFRRHRLRLRISPPNRAVLPTVDPEEVGRWGYRRPVRPACPCGRSARC